MFLYYIILGCNFNEFRKNANVTHNARALRTIAGDCVFILIIFRIYIIFY